LAARSGKIIHIDFGDCFEASMNREKFPERVPFRLTRMLVKAMEVSGIEGNFRSTCQNVMTVLRQNKDSVMAMMEVRHTRPHRRLRGLAASRNLTGFYDVRGTRQPERDGWAQTRSSGASFMQHALLKSVRSDC
jgi:hypothetical protein